MVPFFAPLAIRRINNLRAVNTLNSSTPVDPPPVSRLLSTICGDFARVPTRLSQLASDQQFLLTGFHFVQFSALFPCATSVPLRALIGGHNNQSARHTTAFPRS